MTKTKLSQLSQDEFDSKVSERRAKRMAEIDALKPEIRKCVHDYGYNVVKTLLDLNIKNPRHIRHIVETILDDFSPTRGSHSIQGVRGIGWDSVCTKTDLDGTDVR